MDINGASIRGRALKVPRPPQDTGKPGGQLPQTNFIQRLDWVIFGSILLITALNIYVVKQLIKKGKSTSLKWD